MTLYNSCQVIAKRDGWMKQTHTRREEKKNIEKLDHTQEGKLTY